MEHYMGLEAHKCPPAIGHKDCGIARRCILFLGTELERGAMVLEDPFVWPPMERHGEFAAPTCKLSLTLSERNERWAAALASRMRSAGCCPVAPRIIHLDSDHKGIILIGSTGYDAPGGYWPNGQC